MAVTKSQLTITNRDTGDLQLAAGVQVWMGRPVTAAQLQSINRHPAL
jgi:hypothetical protein